MRTVLGRIERHATGDVSIWLIPDDALVQVAPDAEYVSVTLMDDPWGGSEHGVQL